MSWYAKDALKVEVQFDGTNWTDVSAYVDTSRTMQINRGRDDETGDPLSPGTWSVVLVNDDGRFSPELAASPYYPYVVEDVAIRLSMLANGTYYKRFYGTVQSWSVELLSALANESRCTVTVTDVFGAFPQYTFRQAADEVIRNLGPTYYWPLRDAEAPAQPEVGAISLNAKPASASGWGLGNMLEMDEGDSLHPSFVSNTAGLHLSCTLQLSAPWTATLVLFGKPTTTALGAIGVLSAAYSSSGNTPYPLMWSDTGGFYFGTGAATGLPSTYPVLVAVTSSGYAYMVDAAGNQYSSTPSPATSGWVIKNLQLNDPYYTLGSTWSAGHLAVFGRAFSASDVAAAAHDLLGTRSTSAAPSLIAKFAGLSSIAGAVAGDTILPPLEGRDAADALASVAIGMGARVVDNFDGTLTWVDFPPSDTPKSLPAYRVEPSVTWETSDVGWYSDVTVTWPDGTSYTATRTDGRRASLSIEGVHASRSQDRSMADWLVNSPMKARLSKLSFDLATLPAAEQETLLGIQVGDRVEITSLPSAIMPTSEILIVEGVEEQIGDGVWTVTLTTSPDVYSRLFILDDTTAGVLDSSYILAP